LFITTCIEKQCTRPLRVLSRLVANISIGKAMQVSKEIIVKEKNNCAAPLFAVRLPTHDNA